jgi:hypothetical protein
MKVLSVKLDELNKNATVMDSFKTTMKAQVANQAGPEILPEHVTLKLSAGSVVVEATITPPTTVNADTLKTSLETKKTALATAVATEVKKVPGIDSVRDMNVPISVAPPTMSVATIAPSTTIASSTPMKNATGPLSVTSGSLLRSVASCSLVTLNAAVMFAVRVLS